MLMLMLKLLTANSSAVLLSYSKPLKCDWIGTYYTYYMYCMYYMYYTYYTYCTMIEKYNTLVISKDNIL